MHDAPRVSVCIRTMKLNFALVLAGCVSAGFLTGCVGTLDGHHRAGAPWVKDTVEGRYERTPQEVWTAAADVINHQGTLISDDRVKNTLQASIDERKVWVFIQEIDGKTTRVVIQARTKGGAGDVQLASFVNTEIAVRLASNNLTPSARTPVSLTPVTRPKP